MYPSKQSVQELTVPEHEIQGETQIWQVPLISAYPAGHDATQFPFKKIPLAHVHTPLTDRDPLGQVLTQSAFDKAYPLRHVVQTL